MAEKQGYTKQDNKLFDRIITSQFSARELRLLMLVYRMSTGCQKESLRLKFWNDLQVIGIGRTHYKNIISHLKESNVLIVDWNEKELRLNTDFDSWKMSICRGYTKDRLNAMLSDNLPSRNVTKEVTNEDDSSKPDDSKCYQRGNTNVTKEVTPPADETNDSNDSERPKESIKERGEEKETPASHDPQKRVLENGMTWGELLAIGNGIKIGAFDRLSFGNNADWMRYIETRPKADILKVADMDYVKSAAIRFVIERMYEELKKIEHPPKPKAGERSGKMANATFDAMQEMMSGYEEIVKKEMEAAGGKEAYMERRKKLMEDAGVKELLDGKPL